MNLNVQMVFLLSDFFSPSPMGVNLYRRKQRIGHLSRGSKVNTGNREMAMEMENFGYGHALYAYILWSLHHTRSFERNKFFFLFSSRYVGMEKGHLLMIVSANIWQGVSGVLGDDGNSCWKDEFLRYLMQGHAMEMMVQILALESGCTPAM
ncbi:hypothetical protein K402DRAFT_164809 [Aulographum hederae CBS 113979]|uniref:Uncharacterized protein n=1 Tax=Aulographum hederae CBS 113979 TaxID=1176131 RepID=A0A6G1GRI2_9PEZI|nr:hypothetical protein K402DRAFT_164809 [Aulographum hederae CBS 113979]